MIARQFENESCVFVCAQACLLTIGNVIYFEGGYDPGPPTTPTPSALHQTALCSPMGALK